MLCIIFIIYQWIKLASFGSERVYFTTLVSKKNAFTITVFQMTLSFSFHYKIFELVFLPGDFFYINTRERYMGLYAAYETVVNRAWDATTQKMLLCFIFFFKSNPLHSKRNFSSSVYVRAHARGIPSSEFVLNARVLLLVIEKLFLEPSFLTV